MRGMLVETRGNSREKVIKVFSEDDYDKVLDILACFRGVEIREIRGRDLEVRAAIEHWWPVFQALKFNCLDGFMQRDTEN